MKKINHAHRWTDAELILLITQWTANIDIDQIAEEFGCTRHGINAQILRMRRDGIPVPRRNAGPKADRANQPWTQADVEFLVRRRNDGATAEQIGNEMGRSFLAVQGMIQRLRQEGVGIRMLGSGVRRLWSADVLRTAIATKNLIPVETGKVVPLRSAA